MGAQTFGLMKWVRVVDSTVSKVATFAPVAQSAPVEAVVGNDLVLEDILGQADHNIQEVEVHMD